MRHRLRAKPEPQTHPDADLLTAYIEQVLAPAERGRIVQHLAQCSYCREVVSLSLPEPQPAQVVVQVSAPSRWWVPASRWATAAVAIAIAATLVIEKPWHSTSTPQNLAERASQNPAPVTTTPEPAPAAKSPASAYAPSGPATTTETVKEERAGRVSGEATPSLRDSVEIGTLRPRAAATRSPAKAKSPDNLAPAGTVNGVVASGSAENVPARPALAPPQPELATAQALAESDVSRGVRKDVQQDYVNTNLLGQKNLTDANTIAVTSQPPQPLPEAPQPKQNAARARKSAPRISPDSLTASTMDMPIAPPQTAGAGAPSAADSNLAKTNGFALRSTKSTLSKAVDKTISTLKKAAGGRKPSISSETFSAASPSLTLNLADNDQENRRQTTIQVRWHITSDGRLLRSTDLSQWHEAYPQGPDVQFRVVEPRGSEVWAGGNHGTLIHSWNAGVDWSKLNVPDTSTDITAISIDGENVQVKTSNGKTFVSDDHGKTWVPLDQEPK